MRSILPPVGAVADGAGELVAADLLGLAIYVFETEDTVILALRCRSPERAAITVGTFRPKRIHPFGRGRRSSGGQTVLP